MKLKHLFLILCTVMEIFTFSVFAVGLFMSDILLLSMGLLGMITFVLVLIPFLVYENMTEVK